ncbi:UdgX family uracil-DNA binding protein [Histidinibacterium aquaticum]|uniref:Type-4 uracil-DNA glycosylase n=1 Tax=Histidinibacterium aquaticum TaxID=2613962 RepID=A0A5J5GIS8_9RHOB|nr:UdgX family uracil-DNA binding protein [Histidinibacterium aquaticum]KAA9008149.1 UdgX family uracil-DNA binding protein [Histidinibacterium aquaticum]
MYQVTLPRIGTATAWRDAVRAALAAQVPPERIAWHHGTAADSLFEGAPLPPCDRPVKVSRAFVELADTVIWHADPERFSRLYILLRRLRTQPGLLSDRADPQVAKLRQMEKAVRRCQHKMKAFVRFRDLRPVGPDGGPAPRRSFAAWFEPTHYTLEPTAPFFARRFADMDWVIATPDATAVFENGTLSFREGAPRPDLPEDAAEELWGTYFRNIFNPARVKVRAMTSEMPRKYWKNMPETRHIPELLATAEARTREMAEAAPTLAPARAARVRDRLAAPRVEARMTWDDLATRAAEENRETPEGYGRLVLGEGPPDARLMVVGEQPGDVEDREGRPFVGPAGQLFDRCLAQAGIDRGETYVTNAVKRFKFTVKGKRRIHQSPDRADIEHARWWITREIELLKPALVLGLGGTAAETLTGTRAGILKRRGTVEDTRYGPVFLTVHPSFILRVREADRKVEEERRFVADLEAARTRLDQLAA